jgi:hypothetical protein
MLVPAVWWASTIIIIKQGEKRKEAAVTIKKTHKTYSPLLLLSPPLRALLQSVKGVSVSGVGKGEGGGVVKEEESFF